MPTYNDEEILIDPPHYLLTPHPDAPLFAEESNPSLVIQQLIGEISSPNCQISKDIVRAYLSQAGLVSLFFFEKFILGAFGPYNKLNFDLHLQMANFRQSPYCMSAGARAAVSVSRAFYKTTVCDHGANTWELTRNGDEVIQLTHAVDSKASEWKNVVKTNIDSNPLYGELYPDRVPEKKHSRDWNEERIVMRTRTRTRTEPSIYVQSAAAAGQGYHCTVMVIDDLIGEVEDLDKDRRSSSSMIKKVGWFKTNTVTLLDSAETSRVLAYFTFYAPDDVYVQTILSDLRKVIGYRNEPNITDNEREDGSYTLYHREVTEEDSNGTLQAVFPEVMSVASAQKLLETDPWTYFYQYKNAPLKGGLTTFSAFPTFTCKLLWDEASANYYIERIPDPMFAETTEITRTIPLSSCDVIISVDFAAKDRNITTRTSRGSVAVWACSGDNRRHRIKQSVGYMQTPKIMDWIFRFFEQFQGYVRTIILERAAMQLGVIQLIQNEARQRGIRLPVTAEPAVGKKEVRIENTLAYYLENGLIYLARGSEKEFLEEKAAFPMGSKMDVLDESEKAMRNLHKPQTEEERLLAMFEDDDEVADRYVTDNLVGY